MLACGTESELPVLLSRPPSVIISCFCCYQTPGSIISLCGSNAYLYSTLTTNASIPNRNHGVNLFPVTPYWPPSSPPSSIIFADCFLVIDDMDAAVGAAAGESGAPQSRPSLDLDDSGGCNRKSLANITPPPPGGQHVPGTCC